MRTLERVEKDLEHFLRRLLACLHFRVLLDAVGGHDVAESDNPVAAGVQDPVRLPDHVHAAVVHVAAEACVQHAGA